MKLQSKILLPILLLVVVLMGVSGTLAYLSTDAGLRTSLEDNLEGEAKALRRGLERLIATGGRDMVRIASGTDMNVFFEDDIHSRPNQESASAALVRLADSYIDFERLTVFDASGVTVACSDVAVIGQSFADREYFKEVKATGRTYLSEPFLSRVSNSPVLVVAEPIMRGGQLVGVITGNLSLKGFYNDNVAPVSIGKDGYAFILSKKGEVVAHRKADQIFNANVSEAAEYKRLAGIGAGFHSFVDPTNGETVLVYMEREPKSGMIGIVRADENDVFAGLQSQLRQAILVAVAGIILGFIVVLLIIRPVTQAVRRGAVFAADIARGHLDSTLAVRRKDEIGELADALTAIPKTLKEIVTVYDELGDTVEKGRLDAQGDASRFEGEYADLIQGTNAIMGRYRLVLDSLPSPVVVLGTDLKAVFLNHVAQSLAGEDYHGKTCGQLFGREDYETPQDALRRCLASGKAESAETVAHPRGRTMDVAYSSIPMKDARGNLASVLQLITDVTPIKSSQRTMAEVASHAMEISDRVAAASEELSAQVVQVSKGADMQRERVASTATAMEEMNATVMEVARSAADASAQAESTREKAHTGMNLVDQVVKSIDAVNSVARQLEDDMKNLGEQAESIGGVMNVISDIADQTNLLALNAAIEAARAGEAGRGFAVVADEVRKLAEKTMTATTEVGANIRAIQTSTQANTERVMSAAGSVQEATQLAGTSGEALREIMELVNRNTELVAGIATAAEQQSATSEEINSSVDEINRIADDTATGMAHSSSAVSEIAGMSSELKNLLQRLKAE